ncbi:MAG: hypothetical protein GF331_26585, partial [Chitinivibrionales bacterium]|nr:hypothetical protein [Chitinivibrionales bacterium]
MKDRSSTRKAFAGAMTLQGAHVVLLTMLSATVVFSDSNVASEGTIIASITAPTGGGSRDITIIRDGIIPAVGSANAGQDYNTADGNSAAGADYFGYTFPSVKTFTKVWFQEGRHFNDGGWFSGGSLRVQIQQNGTWND